VALIRTTLAGSPAYYLADSPRDGDEELAPADALTAIGPRTDLPAGHPGHGLRLVPAVLAGSGDIIVDETGVASPWP